MVKDMSRLGRGYLKVGFYTEVLFPEKGIRFIAINNGIDSNNQQDSDFTPFLNIINEWYTKDTSKKIRAVMKSKGEAGEYLCTNPPYGYRKDPDNPKNGLWTKKRRRWYRSMPYAWRATALRKLPDCSKRSIFLFQQPIGCPMGVNPIPSCPTIPANGYQIP